MKLILSLLLLIPLYGISQDKASVQDSLFNRYEEITDSLNVLKMQSLVNKKRGKSNDELYLNMNRLICDAEKTNRIIYLLLGLQSSKPNKNE